MVQYQTKYGKRMENIPRRKGDDESRKITLCSKNYIVLAKKQNTIFQSENRKGNIRDEENPP